MINWVSESSACYWCLFLVGLPCSTFMWWFLVYLIRFHFVKELKCLSKAINYKIKQNKENVDIQEFKYHLRIIHKMKLIETVIDIVHSKELIEKKLFWSKYWEIRLLLKDVEDRKVSRTLSVFLPDIFLCLASNVRQSLWAPQKGRHILLTETALILKMLQLTKCRIECEL